MSDLGKTTIVANPKDCSFHAEQVVTVHNFLPSSDAARVWLGIVIGFGLMVGASCGVTLILLLGKLTKAVWP